MFDLQLEVRCERVSIDFAAASIRRCRRILGAPIVLALVLEDR